MRVAIIFKILRFLTLAKNLGMFGKQSNLFKLKIGKLHSSTTSMPLLCEQRLSKELTILLAYWSKCQENFLSKFSSMGFRGQVGVQGQDIWQHACIIKSNKLLNINNRFQFSKTRPLITNHLFIFLLSRLKTCIYRPFKQKCDKFA